MSLVTELMTQGLRLSAEGDDLSVEAQRPLTEEQRLFIRLHKAELLAEIRLQQQPHDLFPPTQTAEVLALLQTAADLTDLELLPEDRVFIDGMLALRPTRQKHELLSEYRRRWTVAADSSPWTSAKPMPAVLPRTLGCALRRTEPYATPGQLASRRYCPDLKKPTYPKDLGLRRSASCSQPSRTPCQSTSPVCAKLTCLTEYRAATSP